MATSSWSSKVETVVTSDPFPAFVWADSEGHARRIVAAHPLFTGWTADELRANHTITKGKRHRFAIRLKAKKRYDLEEVLSERAALRMRAATTSQETV